MIHKFVVVIAGIILVTIVNILYFIENSNYDNPIKRYYEAPLFKNSQQNESRRYLINTTNCQIPDINPFGEDIIEFIHIEEYTNCTSLELLTYIEKDFGMVTLNINQSLVHRYTSYSLSCCYSEIHRVEGNDDKIWFTTCKYFLSSVAIYHPFIKVSCINTFFIKVYENVHATALINGIKKMDSNVFSVLLVGIDSVSKQNLERTMPKTRKYLEDNFVNLKGYNKIADNTFPNLMAILTGQNMVQLQETCSFPSHGTPNELEDKLSTCPFLWKDFSRIGYITAYAEDHCLYSTFNFVKRGFPNPPTDYYYRPYLLAAEQLSALESKCHTRFCYGPESAGERILNSAKDFFITLKDQPRFGLFWMNTFSHDNINYPFAMDEKIHQFLSDKDFRRSLDNTILVFFSDHGHRFGNIRQTTSGWLEDRLPFIYLGIPKQFQKRFPKKYTNLLVNSERLTTPFDLYNTLQHILSLSNSNYTAVTSVGCPKCISLFEEVEERRSCEDAAIAQNWCTCTRYNHVSKAHPIAQKVALFLVEEVNTLIKTFPEGRKCLTYSLDSIHSASLSNIRINSANESVKYFLVVINAKPEAMFEGTIEVSVDGSDNFKRLGDISRVDRYGSTSYCVQNQELKKFTPCKSFQLSVAIYHPFIKVTCTNIFSIKVYENVHATTLINDITEMDSNSYLSVLLVGIDSVSKQNLERTMPKTRKYLEDNFVNLKGYNKIADNTFPNLMAIFTGQNIVQLDETCSFPTHGTASELEDKLSTCPFLWKEFSRMGYVTAYAEDHSPYSTFNYAKKGFPHQPTDYYYRPYLLAAEQLSSPKSKCHNRFCAGPEAAGGRILNCAKDFSITFKNQPSFGVFWMNTFSHGNINCPFAMDEKIYQFLSDTEFRRSLDDTILVFFSDHGYRFGDIRHTKSGWLEERLPFIYLGIPNQFKKRFPKEYKNLLVNSQRLTTPYDLHNTLKHILSLSNSNYTAVTSVGCPKCLSLFEEVAERRSCEDAAIAQHWCTCTSYNHLPKAHPTAQKAALFLVEEVNNLVKTFPEERKCLAYSLNSIHSASISSIRINSANESVNYVLLRINAKPKAMFEATIEVIVDIPDNFKRIGDISRIDRYGGISSCVQNPELKKYCYCDGFFNAIRHKLCLGLC